MSTIGVRIKEQRNLLGMSQKEFGELGGVTSKSQGAYERDERKPDADYLYLVSDKVDVSYLITGKKVNNDYVFDAELIRKAVYIADSIEEKLVIPESNQFLFLVYTMLFNKQVAARQEDVFKVFQGLFPSR